MIVVYRQLNTDILVSWQEQVIFQLDDDVP
jgi:hypothetical protein